MSSDEKRVTLKWDVSSEIKKAGSYQIVFDYENGQDGVYIESFVLLENGKEIARDDHCGWTGAADIDNVYKFRILALTTAAKYVVQARMYIPNGGTDSAGRVTLKRTGD